MQRDHVDNLIEEWGAERPELDVGALAVVARVNRLAKLAERASLSAQKFSGLSAGEQNVLAALRRAGPPYRLTPTELYRSLLLTSGAMTHRIDRLEEAGYVTRQPDSEDRRRVLVGLTAAGRELIDESIEAHVAAAEELLDPLDAAERERLADLLRRILARLEERTGA